MEQRSTDGGRAHAHFLAAHLSHGNGMEDIGFSTATAHPSVCSLSKIERLIDDFGLLAVG